MADQWDSAISKRDAVDSPDCRGTARLSGSSRCRGQPSAQSHGPAFLPRQGGAEPLPHPGGGVNYPVPKFGSSGRPPALTGTPAAIGTDESRAYYANPLRFVG